MHGGDLLLLQTAAMLTNSVVLSLASPQDKAVNIVHCKDFPRDSYIVVEWCSCSC